MKVNGLDWSIVFTDRDEDLIINGVVHLGVTDRSTQTVYLNASLQGELLRKVLVHELTHVWIFSFGYELDRETEEMFCSFVDTFAEDIIDNSDRFLKESKDEYFIHSKRRFLQN